MEWVWDGSAVWIVQLDYLEPRAGVLPKSLVTEAAVPAVAGELEIFTRSSADQLKVYKKLANARLYSTLGYTMPSFFVLNDQDAINSIVRDGVIPDSVRRDLDALCTAPFVLRTDATGLAPEQRQMLPRSDELRSGAAAAEWLLGKFRSDLNSFSDKTNLALIGHHFIPATASAWCLAMPEERRVRIEALWGIPEGVYFFAHDVYDVDTMHVDLSKGTAETCQILSVRERYKDKFVAPDKSGRWVVHRTAEGPDWSRSIRLESWAKEIAWTSRRVASACGFPVVVMWFVDVARSASQHAVMPWYHEPWEKTEGAYRKATPRKKFRNSEVREIRSRKDWECLMQDVKGGIKVERVTLDPDEDEILRSRKLVDELASHALDHGYVVELSGGLLSHLFYILTKKGCSVECVDLFGTDKEQVEYNKLVRDRIPADIESRGERVEVVQLAGDALIEAIRRKIIEEAYEVADAKSVDEIADELADVREVIEAMSKALGLSEHEVADRQRRKREKRGGLGGSLMLVRTSLSPVVSPVLETGDQKQVRIVSRVEDLPKMDEDFHIDHRVDAAGAAERQLTMTLPVQFSDYSAGEHRFDLSTVEGDRHEMFFNARLERSGASLRLRVRLTNAALQLSLPFGEAPDASQE
ncbi:hypothetical protein GCM10027430_30460 [Lysobacter tyrosinilyticus]